MPKTFLTLLRYVKIVSKTRNKKEHSSDGLQPTSDGLLSAEMLWGMPIGILDHFGHFY